MPITPLHALLWSQEQSRYELYKKQQLAQAFAPEDFGAWLNWLQNATAFTFRGACGSLNVYLEARRRGRHYWYAYYTNGKHTRKRYLGRTTQVTFARLEEAAHSLHQTSSSPCLESQSHQQPDLASDEVASAPPSETVQGMVLLSTRLAPPLLPSLLVGRERLLTRLDEARSHQLTLLSASAGWGKTTLLSAWAARSSFPLAWLSLDELDNEPTRFWVSVLSALRACLPGMGQTALLMLRSPQPPPLTTTLATLLNELNGLDKPTFLLLDDYHLISEQTIHDSVLFLLDHLPAHLHLVLSSRVDPPLALARLRARGQLLELRDEDLRFQEQEAASFLTQRLDLPLSEEEVAELLRRTEGWIVGLQLAVLSLLHQQDRRTFLHTFSGSHRYVLEYVQEEVLARLPVQMRDFLLHTAILNRMNASLCQAVTGEEASGELLWQAERANLFLIPLDEEHNWYRMHDLFREALLSRLYATQSELVALLHQRAAHWYQTQEEFREAITHWLAARDYSSATRLMERVARQLWLDGETTTLYRWVMQLPNALVPAHANLVLTAALYLLNTNYFSIGEQRTRFSKEAEQLMIRVETVLHLPEEAAKLSMDTKLFQQRLRLLHAWNGVFDPHVRGDREQLRLVYQQIQDLEEEEDVAWQMIPLFITFLFHHLSQREGALLVPRLHDAWQQVSQSGDYFAMIEVKRWLVLSYVRAGRLHQAYQECHQALRLLEQIKGYALLTDYFFIGLALVFYEWNRLEEARSALQRVIHEAALWQQDELLAWGYRILVRVELAAGNLGAAYQALQEAEQKAQQTSAFHRSWVVGARIRCWLATGNLVQANDWAEHVQLDQQNWTPHRYEEFLALIRVYLAQQRYSQAVETLERFSAYLDQPGDITTTISFLSLYVVALQQAGMIQQAGTVALRLLTLTEPEGHIRVYLEAGEAMKHVLHCLLDASQDEEQGTSTISPSYVLTLLEAFEQEAPGRIGRAEDQHIQKQEVLPRHSLLRQCVSSASGLAAPLSTPVLCEPLSRQEQRVLRLLAAGRSNREIASALVVSVNTVKSHVKKIYSKLHIGNRVAASQAARQLHLL